MKKRTVLICFGMCAFGITSLAYLVDSDPPYENFMMTVFEFSFFTIFFFGLFISFYFGAKFVKRLLKTK